MTKIEVTQQDIDQGHPTCPGWTAVDLAVRRLIRPELLPGLEMNVNEKLWVGDSAVCPVPPQVVDWMEAYDAEYLMAPITFELDIPAAYLRS